MDIFQIVLFISVLIGIALLVFSLISFTKAKEEGSEGLLAENTIEALDNSIEEADRALTELTTASGSIFKELDEKYQELLFLYSLVDEKKKEVMQAYSNTAKQNPVIKGNKAQPTKSMPSYQNPKLKEITELHNEGLSISDIAKKLSMGQGEVKLILELGKAR